MKTNNINLDVLKNKLKNLREDILGLVDVRRVVNEIKKAIQDEDVQTKLSTSEKELNGLLERAEIRVLREKLTFLRREGHALCVIQGTVNEIKKAIQDEDVRTKLSTSEKELDGLLERAG